MIEKEMKEWIDGATYKELLKKSRFAPAGDPFFSGEVSKYYDKVISEKRDKLKIGEAAQISKDIGGK